jgi:hypothetical protein
MIVAGGRFTNEDSKWVVEALLLKPDPESLAAAIAIDVALQHGATEVELTPAGEAAVAAVLEEPWRIRDQDTGERRLLVHGVVISDRDAHTLISLLSAEGAADEEMVAAQAIDYAIAEKLPSADLRDRCHMAILGVLDDCPAGLAELRAALLREQAWLLGEGLV